MHTDTMRDRKMPTKPFDINLAKQGHPICFRNGKACSIENILADGKVLISFKSEDGSNISSSISGNSLFEYQENGLFNEIEESEHDLMMLETMNKVQDAYEDKKCPDCSEDIPNDVDEGSECSNCGHVFYSGKEDD